MRKKLLKTVSLLCTISLIFSVSAMAESKVLTFGDLASNDWAYDDISSLVQAGIVSGDSSGTIRPDSLISRQEVAKLLVSVRKFEIQENASIDAPDSSSVAEWAVPYFATAMERKIISGYADGSVKGNSNITRAEMATLLVRSINANVESFSAKSFSDVTDDDWYAKNVECAKTLQLIDGYADGTFGGEKLVTRREAFVMAARLYKLVSFLETAK